MMSPGLIFQLIERFPEFFPAEHTTAGRRARAIECGEGWFNLINHLLGTLQWHVRTSPLGRMRQPVLVGIDRERGLLRIRFRAAKPTRPPALGVHRGLGFDVLRNVRNAGPRILRKRVRHANPVQHAYALALPDSIRRPLYAPARLLRPVGLCVRHILSRYGASMAA